MRNPAAPPNSTDVLSICKHLLAQYFIFIYTCRYMSEIVCHVAMPEDARQEDIGRKANWQYVWN